MDKMSDKESMIRQILIGVACTSLGFGSSQMWVALSLSNSVAKQEVAITNLAKTQDSESVERRTSDEYITRQLSDDRIHNDKAITELVQLQATTIKHSDELISMLRLQNQFSQKPN